MTNAYPEKPLVPYKKTTVDMPTVIADLKAIDTLTEVKRAAYVIFRGESGNGASGICFNFCGFQGDSGRWDAKYDNLITGIVQKTENGTSKIRLFLAFKDVSGCLYMLSDKIQARGLYVGGDCNKVYIGHIDNPNELATAYYQSWVTGKPGAIPPASAVSNFLSMYNQAAKLFH